MNGATFLAADVTLAPLDAGDYVIEMIVGSGADSKTRLVAIRVAQ